MSDFFGEYEATLDAKGRFLFPAAFKKQLDGATSPFIIKRGFEKCLTLYTKEAWEQLFSKIKKLNEFDPKVREFTMLFLNGAVQIEADTAGRLLVSKNLAEHAGLEKDIVL